MTRCLAMDIRPRCMAGKALRIIDPSRWFEKIGASVVPDVEPTCAVCGFVARKGAT
jgi:hypothetical protein